MSVNETHHTVDEEGCNSPSIVRLEYVASHVSYGLEDGELRPSGNTDILYNGPYKETDTYRCTNCDTKFDGEEEALQHLRTGSN